MGHHGLLVIHEPQLASLILDHQGLNLSDFQPPDRLGLAKKNEFSVVLFKCLKYLTWSKVFWKKSFSNFTTFIVVSLF